MPRWMMIGLVGLMACGGGDPGSDDEVATDDTEAPPVEYGPENSWPHALEDDVPADLAGTGYKRGDVVHNFTFTDQFGDEVELYQFYGNVIVLDLFAQWCGPCQQEAPGTQQHYEELKDQGLVVIAAMAENNGGNTPSVDNLNEWVDAFGVTHTMGIADGDELNFLNGYPTFVVIDRDMTVISPDLWPVDWSVVEDAL